MDKPDHVEEMEGGYMCRHCGGLVSEDGMAEDLGEDPGADGAEESDKVQRNPLDASFARAMKRGLNSKMEAE